MNSFELFNKSYRMQIDELTRNVSLIDGESVDRAIKLILESRGKLVCSGMGKSGLIAQKLAATFSSTGTPAFFLHPGESLHGDLGVIQKDDIILVLAKSGESEEVILMLQAIRKMGNPIIAILGKADSAAGRLSDVIIAASVSREADPLNLAPTASSTVSLVVGDALASALCELRGFKQENFALLHPAGQLGKRLLLKVEDLLITDRGQPIVREDATISELLEVESKPNLGGVMVVDQQGKLIGLVTDGDIRRGLTRFKDFLEHRTVEIMTKNPTRITAGASAFAALELMENRPSPVSVLPVVDAENKPVGLLRLHDLLRSGL
ncbi:MAG: KpsF/GutQ family sugar-phosphate isomerase [Leptospirales bacterium]|nr:KpsF/GutQ family sugar-phosphate isomerase [Leptospirales bacterium]